MDEKKIIPLLEADDIECRVQSVSEGKSGKIGATLLLYKDARVDMRILDLVYGSNNWQRTHEVVNGNLFCSIDIWDESKKMWVRKQDVGTKSNTEEEKGEASDSFKRAGTNVGIGRELYTAPFIYVALNDGEYSKQKSGNKETYKCFTKFKVTKVGYNDRREINDLIISDGKGNVRFNMNGYVQKPQNNLPEPKEQPKEEPQEYKCCDCGTPFEEFTTKAGKKYSPGQAYHIAMSKDTEGKPRCRKCRLAAKTNKEA